MDYNAFYAEIIACLALFVTGMRLYRLGVRTRKPPERILSASFLLWALGYFLYDLPYALVDDESLLTPFFFASDVCIDLGTIAFALFIRTVFRRRERWARWLVVGTIACLFTSSAGSVWIGDWLGEYPLRNAWYWLRFVASAGPAAWMAAEGLHEHRRARQRLRLGLLSSNPLTCNQFLLWGVAGIFWTLLEVVAAAQQIEYELTGNWSTFPDLLAGACEIIPVVLIWLTFFPPTAYRGWIENRAVAANPTQANTDGVS